MEEELDWFQKNDVWKLVELPKRKKAIWAKWVFRNKLDENGKVVRNKETYVPLACLEAIRILLLFASYSNMKLYPMDVKSAFLNGVIQ